MLNICPDNQPNPAVVTGERRSFLCWVRQPEVFRQWETAVTADMSSSIIGRHRPTREVTTDLLLINSLALC